MIAAAAGVFSFLALTVGAFAVAGRSLAGRRAYEARLRDLRSDRGASDQPEGVSVKRPGSPMPALRRRRESAWAASIATDLQQANIQLRVVEYFAVRVMFALVFLAVPLLLLRSPIGLALAPVAGIVGYAAPGAYVRSARRRRIARIEQQLLDFLPSLASSLRSGFAFQQGVETAAQHLGPPLAAELASFLKDVNLGAMMDEALQGLGRRIGSTDLDMVITAILVQRTSGGSLSEILDQAAETLRERERILGDVRVLTAQQRLTGIILSVYPVVIGLLLLAVMPSVWSKLFTERAGQIELAIALGLQLLGFVAIRRALDIDV